MKTATLAILLCSAACGAPEQEPLIAESEIQNCEEGRIAYSYSRIHGDIVAVEESVYTSTYGHVITYYFKRGQVIAAHASILTLNPILLEQEGVIELQSTEYSLSPNDSLDTLSHGRKQGSVAEQAAIALKWIEQSRQD